MKLFARAYIIVQNISLTDPQFSRVNMNDETITHPRQPTSFQIKYACAHRAYRSTKGMWLHMIRYSVFKRDVSDYTKYESLFVWIWRDQHLIKIYSGHSVVLKHVAQVLWNMYSTPWLYTACSGVASMTFCLSTMASNQSWLPVFCSGLNK